MQSCEVLEVIGRRAAADEGRCRAHGKAACCCGIWGVCLMKLTEGLFEGGACRSL